MSEIDNFGKEQSPRVLQRIVAVDVVPLHAELDEAYSQLVARAPDKLAPVHEQYDYAISIARIAAKREMLLRIGEAAIDKLNVDIDKK